MAMSMRPVARTFVIYLSSAWYFTSFINKPETFTAKKTFQPAVAGGACLNLGGTTGVAPSSPADGDVWQTSAGLIYRNGSVTEGPLAVTMKGASVALAGTITLGPGSHIHITAGTGPITDIDWTLCRRWPPLHADLRCRGDNDARREPRAAGRCESRLRSR